jgi:four helix bundle protein
MGVRRYQDLVAWQLADQFEEEIHRLVLASDGATRDRRFTDQILEASSSVPSCIAEGFLRYWRRDFARFLDFALASIGEAERRLRTGVRRRHFTDADCEPALRLGKRCLTATVRLKQSLLTDRPGPGHRSSPSKTPRRRPPTGTAENDQDP